MADRSFATVSGFRELEAVLAELPIATGKNVLRRIGKGALGPMADEAARLAPHRSGRLAYSITISEKRTSRAKWQSGRFRSAASPGIVMAMGPASGLGTLQYASFDEFGTVDTPAFGYMRAAWDSHAYGALDYIKANLAEAVFTAAARYARRRAKAQAV